MFLVRIGWPVWVFSLSPPLIMLLWHILKGRNRNIQHRMCCNIQLPFLLQSPNKPVGSVKSFPPTLYFSVNVTNQEQQPFYCFKIILWKWLFVSINYLWCCDWLWSESRCYQRTPTLPLFSRSTNGFIKPMSSLHWSLPLTAFHSKRQPNNNVWATKQRFKQIKTCRECPIGCIICSCCRIVIHLTNICDLGNWLERAGGAIAGQRAWFSRKHSSAVKARERRVTLRSAQWSMSPLRLQGPLLAKHRRLRGYQWF